VPEKKAADEKINSVYKAILELLSERAVEPGDALAACLAVAARIAKIPPRGINQIHINRFLKICRDAYHSIAAVPVPPPTIERH
jgi:hypothetical protein